MKAFNFHEICQDASVALGLENSMAMYEGDPFNIDGIGVSLFYDESVASDRMFCYVDLGTIPREGRENVLEGLLKLNLISGAKTNGVYGYDEESKHAMFAVQLANPQEIDGDSLANALKIYATMARATRDAMLNAEGDDAVMSGEKPGTQPRNAPFGLHV